MPYYKLPEISTGEKEKAKEGRRGGRGENQVTRATGFALQSFGWRKGGGGNTATLSVAKTDLMSLIVIRGNSLPSPLFPEQSGVAEKGLDGWINGWLSEARSRKPTQP